MKTITMIGAVLIVLGVLSFVIPIPRTEDHGVKIGDTKVGVQTQTSQKVPVGASVTLIGVGVLTMVLGARKP